MDLVWLETKFEALTQLSDEAIKTQLQTWSQTHPKETTLLRKMLLCAEKASRFDDPLRLEFVQTKPKVEDHTIGDLLGRGGMGTVYYAEQHKPIERQVALKILHINLPVHVTKFIEERQTLSKLQHPNIAQVLQAGVDQLGRPWFTMPIIEGEPIIAFCQRFQLSLRERLELFSQVCDGIHHSHQRGVLHRDIKPSNVLAYMIDGKPTVKIIDFGIATDTASAVSDKDSPFLGSIPYISPEQLLQDEVDTRSDVFSLGVLLYEMLVGLPPFPIGEETTPIAYEEILRTHEAIQPSSRLQANLEHLKLQAREMSTKPGQLKAGLNRDLTAVVMKCLVYDKRGRYASVDALAKDLQALLNHDPVSVRKPKLIEWPAYFYRRDSLKAILYGLILALIPISTLVYIRYQENQFERQRAEQEKINAEVLFKTYRDMSRYLLVLQSSWYSEKTPSQIKSSLSFSERQFRNLKARTSQAQLDLNLILASLNLEIGAYPKSKNLFEEAIKEIENQPFLSKWKRLQAYDGLARSQLGLGLLNQARQSFQTLKEASQDLFPSSTYQVRAEIGLGMICLEEGDARLAQARFEEWIPKLEQNPEIDPLEIQGNRIIQALTLSRLGDFPSAERILRKTVRNLTNTTYEHHPFLLAAKFNLATILLFQKANLKYAGALHCEIFDARFDLFDDDHPDVLQSLDALAMYDIELGHFEDAQHWLGMMQKRDPTFGRFTPQNRLKYFVRLAIVQDKLQFVPLEEIKLELLEEVQNARLAGLWQTPIYLTALNNLADYSLKLTRPNEAKYFLDEAVSIHGMQSAPTNKSRLYAETTLGQTLEALDKQEEAIKIYVDILHRSDDEPYIKSFVSNRLQSLTGSFK